MDDDGWFFGSSWICTDWSHFSMYGLLADGNSRSSETPWTSLVVEFHVGSEISLEDSFLASSQAGSAVES